MSRIYDDYNEYKAYCKTANVEPLPMRDASTNGAENWYNHFDALLSQQKADVKIQWDYSKEDLIDSFDHECHYRIYGDGSDGKRYTAVGICVGGQDWNVQDIEKED